jgi:hypothetical protein
VALSCVINFKAVQNEPNQHRKVLHTVGDEIVDEVLSPAQDVRAARICHINSTAYGAGVPELLRGHLRLCRVSGFRPTGARSMQIRL